MANEAERNIELTGEKGFKMKVPGWLAKRLGIGKGVSGREGAGGKPPEVQPPSVTPEPAGGGEPPSKASLPELNPAVVEIKRSLKRRVGAYWKPFLDRKEITKEVFDTLTAYGISPLDDSNDTYSQLLKGVLEEDKLGLGRLIAHWVDTAELEGDVLLNTQQEILVGLRAKIRQTGERERKAPIQKVLSHVESNLGKKPSISMIEDRTEEEVLEAVGSEVTDIRGEETSAAWVNTERRLQTGGMKEVTIEVEETAPTRDEQNVPIHDGEGNLVFKKERVKINVPIYRGLTLDKIEKITRDYLDEVTLSDGNIRTSSLEHRHSYGLIWAARSIALQIGTPQAIKRADDLRMEYEAIRANLNWWTEAVREPARGGGGFSNNFNNGITFGGMLPGEFLAWLQESYRGKDFIRGFAAPREEVYSKHFTNASQLLGARLRMSSGIGSKDEVIKPGQPKPDAEAGSYYMLSDGTRVKVITADGRVTDRTKGGKGFMYETYKNFMLPYAYSYLETRYKYMDLAFEPTIDPATGEQVFVCHASPDRYWGYDAFQHPKFLAKFWYGNIDLLPDRFKYQLGWRSDLGANPADNKRLNMALLGTGNDFLNDLNDLKKTTAQTRAELWKAMRTKDDENIDWDEGWNMEKKIEAMVKLGMVRKFGNRTWGVGDNNTNLILTQNLISLDSEKIGEDFWTKANWRLLPQGGAFLGDWCQQMLYLQAWRNQELELLNGDKINEAKEFLGSGNGWRHIPDVISPFMEKERNWWYDIISRMELLSFRKYREKGNRLNLAVEIRNRIPAGFLKGHFRRVWFSACGIRNMDWSDNIASIQIFQKVRQFFQGMNEVKVVEEGLLRDSGVSYENLVDFAGLKVKRYHHDMIHLLTDEEGRWDTWENIPILSMMKTFIDDYLANFQENRRIIGDGGERTKKKWIKATRAMEKLDLSKKEEAEKFRNLKGELGLDNDWDKKTTVAMIRKTLGIFEEWETEVDLKEMSEFLGTFLTAGLIGDGTRAAFESLREGRGAWFTNWHQNNQRTAKNIFQVWGEFEEMNETDYRDWYRTHREIEEKILKITVDWPARTAWDWGKMEGGRPGLGAEELEMALWAVAEGYKARYYEGKSQPWRRFGPKFNLWEREKGIYRVMRRQKAAMDFRSEELKKIIKGKVGDRVVELQDPSDIIVGRWHYNQMEWDPVTKKGDLIIHDRPIIDPYGGIDPLKSLLMGTGEFYAGDGREVSPLWIGHSSKRIIYRYLSRASVWYQIEHAKLAGEKYNMNWKDYWREYHLARRVMSPSKISTIMKILSSTGTLDPNEDVPYLRSMGATDKEIIQYWVERRGYRLPNDQDQVKGEIKSEIQSAFLSVMEGMKSLTGGAITRILTGGRTGTEIKFMIRNAALLGAAGSFGLTGSWFWVSSIIGTGVIAPGLVGVAGGLTGVVVGALAGFDRGDLVGGWSYFFGRYGGLLGERIKMSDPESLALGYVPPKIPWLRRRPFRIVSQRLPYAVEKMIAQFRTPAGNDDTVSSRDTSQAVADSKEHLGGEGSKSK